MKFPHGQAEVLSFYGNPCKPDGTLNPEWEKANIVTIDLPAPLPYADDPKVKITKITCHRKCADSLKAALAEVQRAGYWSRLVSYGGGYVFRANRNAPGKLSLHSYGAAWDFDPLGNPNGSKNMRMDRNIVAIFEHFGFTWGGTFRHPDGMHFQGASGI